MTDSIVPKARLRHDMDMAAGQVVWPAASSPLRRARKSGPASSSAATRRTRSWVGLAPAHRGTRDPAGGYRLVAYLDGEVPKPLRQRALDDNE
jgi:hypothetical protein